MSYMVRWSIDYCMFDPLSCSISKISSIFFCNTHYNFYLRDRVYGLTIVLVLVTILKMPWHKGQLMEDFIFSPQANDASFGGMTINLVFVGCTQGIISTVSTSPVLWPGSLSQPRLIFPGKLQSGIAVLRGSKMESLYRQNLFQILSSTKACMKEITFLTNVEHRISYILRPCMSC